MKKLLKWARGHWFGLSVFILWFILWCGAFTFGLLDPNLEDAMVEYETDITYKLGMLWIIVTVIRWFVKSVRGGKRNAGNVAETATDRR